MGESLAELIDRVGLSHAVEELDRRYRFIETQMDEAQRLTAWDRQRHLVVVRDAAGRDAVACSWPLPPVHARFVETVPVGSYL